MRKALIPAFLLVLGAVVLGSTVFSEQIAHAASPFTNVIVGNTSTNPVPVTVQNTDTNGNVKVHEQGTANVNVLGTVTTQSGLPSTAFSKVYQSLTGVDEVVSGPDQSGTRYAISSFTVANADSSATARVDLQGVYGNTSDCRNFSPGFHKDGPELQVPPGDTREMTFPQPFVFDAQSGSACLLVGGSGDIVVTLVGYSF